MPPISRRFGVHAALLVALVVSAGAFGQQTMLSFVGQSAGNELGRSIGTGGDVDGDGVADMLVGARGSPTGSFPGRVWVYSGTGAPLHSFLGYAAGDEFGSAATIVGDVNGDGFADILIGARSADLPGAPSIGKAYLFSGETPGHANDYALLATFSGIAPGDNFGQAVANLGDIDGDMVPDFGIGAPGYVNLAAGKLHIFSGATQIPIAVVSIGEVGDWFGYACAKTGDLDGDGFNDFIVSAIGSTVMGMPSAGRVYAFRGFTPGHSADFSQLHTFEGEQANASFGVSLADLGDIDGDGHCDVIVGSNRYDAPGAPSWENRGKAYVFSGTGALLYEWAGEAVQDWFGIGVGSAGDADGDGHLDIAVGACQTEKGGVGYAYVFRGTTGELMYSMHGEYGPGIPHQGDAFGFTVASVGDLDADGTDELAVGAYGFNGYGGLNTGKVYVCRSGVRYFHRNAPTPQILDLRVTGWPTLGTTCALELTGAPPSTFGLLGFSVNGGEIPLFGGTFLLDPLATYLFPFDSDATGHSAFGIVLPLNVTMLGAAGRFQAATLAPGLPGYVAFSNGVSMTLVY